MNTRTIMEATNELWNKALNTGNIDELVSLYTENAILSPGNGITVVGRAEIQSLFTGFIEDGVHNHMLEIIEVDGTDNIIYQVAKWSAQGAESNGKTPTFGGITTSIYELSADGNWLARAHIWNVKS
jgi:uncharacterized protein (TIGR02246 family)